jgi:hypothetical protein
MRANNCQSIQMSFSAAPCNMVAAGVIDFCNLAVTVAKQRKTSLREKGSRDKMILVTANLRPQL